MRKTLALFGSLIALTMFLTGCSDVGTVLKTESQAHLTEAEADKSQAGATLSQAEAERIAAQAVADSQRANAQQLAELSDRYAEAQEARVRDAQMTAIGIAGFSLIVIVVIAIALMAVRRPVQRGLIPVPPAARPVRYSIRAPSELPEQRALRHALEEVVLSDRGNGNWS